MKLLKKLNFILLPVITLVFLALGATIYNIFSNNMRQDLIEVWHSRLQVVQSDVSLELRSFRSAISEVLNSPEVISWVQSNNSQYQNYQVKNQLYMLINRVRKNSPYINTFQLLDTEGNIFVSVDESNPFDKVSLAALPTDVIEDFIKKMFSGDVENQQKSILYHDNNQHENLGILQAFSSGLILNDGNLRRDGDSYAAILTGKINAFYNTRKQLHKEIGDGFTLTVMPTDPLSSVNHDEVLSGVRISGSENEFPVTLLLDDPLYQLKLTFGKDVLSKQRSELAQEIAALMILSIIFCFFSLRILIRRQIVKPIDDLVTNIENSWDGEELTLVPSVGKDEVSILNNAYLRLLDKVNHEATHDPLTGMPNRRRFHQLLLRFVERAQKGGSELALLFLDLDNFKHVNDHFGHAEGDMLLKVFSEQLLQVVRPSDSVALCSNDDSKSAARLAGDEFAVLLHDAGAQAAQRVASCVLKFFEDGFKSNGNTHNVKVSIGIAIFPQDAHDADTLLERADAAMYEAKIAGKNRYHFYSPEIGIQMKSQKRIENHLVKALENDKFELNFMPIFSIDDMEPVGAEVLLRYPPLQREGIGPAEFIPLAEATGLINKIDLWVIENSFKTLKNFIHKFNYLGFLAINISSLELNNEFFPQYVRSLIEKYQIPTSQIEFEVTETGKVFQSAICTQVLNELKNMGFSIALDDFGSGYTAFSQLKNYPIDCLKIDKSYTGELSCVKSTDESTFGIINRLGKLYNLRVVAEGVETLIELDRIRESSCDYVQGFYLSKPLTQDEFLNWIKSHSYEPKFK